MGKILVITEKPSVAREYAQILSVSGGKRDGYIENDNYIILDVRTIEEYNEGHIPNAICVPNEIIDESVITKLPIKDQLILIYCRSGNRSKQAAAKLANLGYTNLVEFGGIIDWDGEIER